MKIVILGKPIPKQRPRFAKRGKFTVTYDPLEKEKHFVKYQMKKALREAMDSPNKEIAIEACSLASHDCFEVHFWFYLPVNESDSKFAKNSKLWGLDLPAVKPDYDNLEKFYLDCANEVLFPDDAMIVDASSHKRYSNNPRVEIEIMAKKQPKVSNNTEKILTLFSPEELNDFLNHTKAICSFEGIQRYSFSDSPGWIEEFTQELSDYSIKYSAIFKKISSLGPYQKFSQCKAALQQQEIF